MNRFVASLATKLSDTFASEIGKGFGKRTFLITTFKPVPPGTEVMNGPSIRGMLLCSLFRGWPTR
eukprot:scaffold1437_cov268-Pinguiococcus_pyrenoidosus.AAC.12